MEKKTAQKLEWVVWSFLGLVILGIIAAFILQKNKVAKPLPVLRVIPDFHLTNQFGKIISKSDLQGTVFLADIFFTRCPGPCTQLSKRMSRLQNELPPAVKLISLTADPAFDSSEVLKKYGERFGADVKRWTFLTGTKKEIYTFAMDGLMLAVQEKEEKEKVSIEDMFIHSTMIVLVDGKGRVRSFYESDKPESHDQIIADVKNVLREH